MFAGIILLFLPLRDRHCFGAHILQNLNRLLGQVASSHSLAPQEKSGREKVQRCVQVVLIISLAVGCPHLTILVLPSGTALPVKGNVEKSRDQEQGHSRQRQGVVLLHC